MRSFYLAPPWTGGNSVQRSASYDSSTGLTRQIGCHDASGATMAGRRFLRFHGRCFTMSRFAQVFPVAALLLGTNALVAAQPDPAESSRAEQARAALEQRFTAADVNADGRLSRAEAQAGMRWVHRNFDRIDSSASGAVTLAQIERHAATQAAARRGASR